MDNDASLAFSMFLKPGTLLQGGKYKIVRFISNGGFGCTYEAVHVMLNKRVAIKEFFVKDFCNRDSTTSAVSIGTTSKSELVEKLRKKFIDEARAISSLSHPGIVQVSDVFSENGTAYYVMGYIEGKSLRDLVKENGPLDESLALKYISQICEALRYVHSKNRLHLDIKPGNIMLDGKDNAILIDFGVSKQYDEAGGENTSTLLGKTQGYAPLEQLGGNVKKFMPATDIYALGATLYMLLSGKKPISANDLAQGDELPPLPPYISDSTRRAVNRAMRVKNTERPQSVDEFMAMLFEPAESDGGNGTIDQDDVTIVSGDDISIASQVPPVPPVPPVPHVTDNVSVNVSGNISDNVSDQQHPRKPKSEAKVTAPFVGVRTVSGKNQKTGGIPPIKPGQGNPPVKTDSGNQTKGLKVTETGNTASKSGVNKTIWIVAFIIFIVALCIYVIALYSNRSVGSYYDDGYAADTSYVVNEPTPVEEYVDETDTVAVADEYYY